MWDIRRIRSFITFLVSSHSSNADTIAALKDELAAAKAETAAAIASEKGSKELIAQANAIADVARTQANTAISQADKLRQAIAEDAAEHTDLEALFNEVAAKSGFTG